VRHNKTDFKTSFENVNCFEFNFGEQLNLIHTIESLSKAEVPYMAG
jgi:hypothetical protein